MIKYNKKIKRIFALGLSGAMLIGTLNGCGNSSKASNSSEKTIILHILENDTAKSEGYLENLIQAFNEEYKDKNIKAVDANMDEYTDLAANGPYGYGPDIIYQANDKLMTFAEDKHIIPINIEELDCYEYIPDMAWEAFKVSVDGEDYYCGVPVNIQEPMLFYRADLMPENWQTEWDDDNNGVADFFENWNDLYAYSSYLRENDESANKNSQYGYMASLNNLYLSSQFLLSYGAYIFGENSDGTVNTKDIGFSANDAAYGINALKQFAGLMNEGCIDDTITLNRYEKLAGGAYFCTVSTPDTYSLFMEKLEIEYESEGLSSTEAHAKAKENLVMIELPYKLPVNGDLSVDSAEMKDSDFIRTVVMGGVNGYGISSYTENREACLEFVNFATSYEMIKQRADVLGIAPTRQDVAEEVGETSNMIFTSLAEGRIYLMPSVKAVDQIWVPAQSQMSDIAKDAFRAKNGETEKYPEIEDLKVALEVIDKNVYDAIYTLAE